MKLSRMHGPKWSYVQEAQSRPCAHSPVPPPAVPMGDTLGASRQDELVTSPSPPWLGPGSGRNPHLGCLCSASAAPHYRLAPWIFQRQSINISSEVHLV